MFDLLERATTTVRQLVAGLEPERLAPADAVRLVELLGALERVAAAGRALAAVRVADSGAWKSSGQHSAAHWLAAASGTSVGHAATALESARRLRDLPAVDAAARSGALSLAQTTEVASAAGAAPDREADLIELAERSSLAELQHECRAVQASAAGAAQLDRYRRIHERRYARTWTDADGAVRLDARLTPDAGARLRTALEVERDRVFAAARRDGRREPYEAYAADALVALVSRDRAEGTNRGPRATVHVRVDHAALVRGHTESGETCEIPGVGPIPVATARRLADDSILKILVTDGVDVRAVAHGGRTIPTRLRTALEQRDQCCVVPGCSAREHLEIHHLVPFARGGPTTLGNLARVCTWHHDRITNDGFTLARGEAGWTWRQPRRARAPAR
jgi:hypothetical protein